MQLSWQPNDRGHKPFHRVTWKTETACSAMCGLTTRARHTRSPTMAPNSLHNKVFFRSTLDVLTCSSAHWTKHIKVTQRWKSLPLHVRSLHSLLTQWFNFCSFLCYGNFNAENLRLFFYCEPQRRKICVVAIWVQCLENKCMPMIEGSL